jgi:hypothetical protein
MKNISLLFLIFLASFWLFISKSKRAKKIKKMNKIKKVKKNRNKKITFETQNKEKNAEKIESIGSEIAKAMKHILDSYSNSDEQYTQKAKEIADLYREFLHHPQEEFFTKNQNNLNKEEKEFYHFLKKLSENNAEKIASYKKKSIIIN